MNPEEIVKQLRQGTMDPQEAVRQFEAAPWKNIGEVGLDAAKIETVSSGFTQFDDALLLKTNTYELISLAALPGMGKSQLAFQIAAHVAENNEVLYFSTEMTANVIAARIAAARHTIPLKSILEGDKHKKLPEALKDLGRLKLGIVDDFKKTIDEVIRISTLASRTKQLGLIVLDQMPQLVESHEGHEGISRITSALKTLARECRCPVLQICQLNRGLQNRSKQRDKAGNSVDDGKPIFSDLRGSSSIEQDSDIVVVLTAKHSIRPNITEVGIIKNKNGKTGWFELKWYSSFVQFANSEDSL